MSYALPERPFLRRWRRSRRTSPASDLTLGVLLFVFEAAVFLWRLFGYGMEVWAAQGVQSEIDAALRAELAWMQYFLVATLVLAGFAVVARAPWTAGLQLLAVGLVAVLLVFSQAEYDRTHPAPAPTPRAGYSPCYSGSGTCG